MDSKIFKKCQELIKRECCNYSSGDCIALDEECAMLNIQRNEAGEQRYRVCSWFKQNVLPTDDKLQHEFMSSTDAENINSKVCALCGGMFIPKDGRQTMCSKCKALDSRMKNIERRRKRYGK